jgi:hypothetical protein
MINEIRRRAEFLAGAPLVVVQHLSQRIQDGFRDAGTALHRERRNARFIGEMTVRAVRHARSVGASIAPAVAIAEPLASATAVSQTEHDHLGVAELIAAIPEMSAGERTVLLAAERAGRNRTRIITLLEQLGA